MTSSLLCFCSPLEACRLSVLDATEGAETMATAMSFGKKLGKACFRLRVFGLFRFVLFALFWFVYLFV